MRVLIAALVCALGAAPLASRALPKLHGQTPADVANAELAFAKLASEKGINASFLANFAEGSMILNPEPIDARAHYAKEQDPGFLSWRPAWVGLSSSGDLAYSTGPWEYRAKPDQPPIVRGHFLSLWAKQADGTWKVAFDCGVSHGAAPEAEGWHAFLPEAVRITGGGSKDLRTLDRLLTTGQSKLDRLAFGATLYRKGALPLKDRDEASAALKAEPARSYEPQGAVVSEAQDLGYTWGLAGAADGSRVSYLHVWARPSGVWRLLYDLELPMPAKP